MHEVLSVHSLFGGPVLACTAIDGVCMCAHAVAFISTLHSCSPAPRALDCTYRFVGVLSHVNATTLRQLPTQIPGSLCRAHGNQSLPATDVVQLVSSLVEVLSHWQRLGHLGH